MPIVRPHKQQNGERRTSSLAAERSTESSSPSSSPPRLTILAARYGWAEDLWKPTVLDNTTGSKDVTDICRKLIRNNRLHINPECQPQWMNTVFWPEQTLWPPLRRCISIKFQLGNDPVQVATSSKAPSETVDLLIESSSSSFLPAHSDFSSGTSCSATGTGTPLSGASTPTMNTILTTSNSSITSAACSPVVTGNEVASLHSPVKFPTAAMTGRPLPHHHDAFTACTAAALDASLSTSNQYLHASSINELFFYPDFGSQGICTFIPFGATDVLCENVQVIWKPQPQDYEFKTMLGQLPANSINVSPAKLAWIFATIGKCDLRIGVSPGTRLNRLVQDDNREKRSRKKQSFRLVFFTSEEQQAQAHERIHQRILLDHNGVWYARNADEERALMRYVADSEVRPRNSPKSAVTLLPCAPHPESKPPKRIAAFDSSSVTPVIF